MNGNRQRNQKTIRNRFGIWVAAIGIAILLLAAMAPIVSAKEVTAYAYKAANVDGHKGLYYIIPHSATAFPLKASDSCPTSTSPCCRPYVGGVRQDLLNSIPLEDHKDPQKWEYYSRQQRNQYTDEVVLMIPTLYTYANWNYANEISIKVTYS